MSFQAPWFLLALALVPLGLAAYAVHERRRRALARAFAAAPVTPSVLPRRARWRAHVPAALGLTALAALAVALARPSATVAVPVESASVVLATDVSGSMQATDVAPSRMVAAQRAARTFAAEAPDRVRIGVLEFNHLARVLQTPTDDRAAVRAALDQLHIAGGTATGDALHTALGLVRTGAADRRPAAIVLLSDGAATKGRDVLEVARRAKALGVPVYTIALGTQSGTIVTDGRTERVPPDVATMRQVAQITGGKAFQTADAAQLAEVYEQLGSQVATEKQERELTAGFAGGALVLVLAGASLSLFWFGRITP